MYMINSKTKSSIIEHPNKGALPEGKGTKHVEVMGMCAHMGGFLGPNSLHKGPIFGRFSLKHGWVFQKLVKNC